MGKGSARRSRQITREEETLRWRLATKEITFLQFEQKYRELKEQGKIIRGGRVCS